MVARLILALIQLAAGWFVVVPYVMPHMPTLGQLDIFVLAALFAIACWVLGLVAALVVKDVAQPSPPTLLFAFATAVIFAVLTLLPDVTRAVSSVLPGIPAQAYPLVGAVLGYAVKR